MEARASQDDPYRTFKYLVTLDGETVAGVTKVSALSRTVAANEVKEAGDLFGARQNPGQVSYDDVTLEWGLSKSNAFESWANAAVDVLDDPKTTHFKRTVEILVYDLRGNLNGGPSGGKSIPVLKYRLHNAWVSKFTALPALDASTSGIGIQSITLKHEGWEKI